MCVSGYIKGDIYIIHECNFSYSDENTVVQTQIFVRVQLQVFLFIYSISVYLTLRCIILRRGVTTFYIPRLYHWFEFIYDIIETLQHDRK